MNEREKMRKLLDTLADIPVSEKGFLEKNQKKPSMIDKKILTEYNDELNNPQTKVEIEFSGPDEAEVEIQAKGMDEIKRLVDLAGIFHNEKAANMGIQTVNPTGDIDIPAGPVSMDNNLTNIDMDHMNDMDMDHMNDMDMDHMNDMDMQELPRDHALIPVDNISNDDESTKELEENEFDVMSGKAHDYGNPDENMGQSRYKIDAFSFAGGASKPVRFVPARSGDNPMVDVSHTRGLKEYISDLQKEFANDEKAIEEEIKPNNLEKFVAATFDLPKKPANVVKAIDTAAKKLSKSQQELKGKTPEQVAALVMKDKDVQQVGGLKPNDENEINQNVKKLGKEFDEARRNWSFQQRVLPFQGLTGTQRIHRNAIRRIKQKLKK